jgi:Arc/MetJ-type ribon-helix-helix transcriptional regulator
MEVHLAPELQAQVEQLIKESGYPLEVAAKREMLDSRYDDLKSGKVKAIDGEEFFESLRKREEDLSKKK